MAQLKKMGRLKRSPKCSLLPHVVEEIFSLQEVQQQIGWSISAFNLPDGWGQYGAGEGCKVAVLDTGCDLNHPDLKGNLLPGINFVNRRKPPIDDNGHGTHVAGIIAAENNDLGMVGVAPKTKIIPVKVLDGSGNGNLNNVAKGIKWAIGARADFICMSLGAPRPVKLVHNAIKEANRNGIPVFCAAGNAGSTKEVYYPAAYKETIAIGSIDKNFKRSRFSNTGRNLDFLAPGGRIFSTVPDDWYAFMSGTSQATPFVVGIASLVKSYARNHNHVDFPLRTVEDYRNVFRKHTTPVGDKQLANKKFYQGFGIIDPIKMMKSLNDQKS